MGFHKPLLLLPMVITYLYQVNFLEIRVEMSGGATVEEQMSHCFENLRLIIEEAGASSAQIVQIRSLIVNHEEKFLEPLYNHVIALCGSHLPASTLIPVPRLALDDMLFEIEATLYMPE